MKVERKGKIINMHPKLAKVLMSRGIVKEHYQTRDMADHPMVTKIAVSDGLEELDKAQLHALAKERGLQLHHMLGADKVRAALRGESQK